jgi:hypothetical protein
VGVKARRPGKGLVSACRCHPHPNPRPQKVRTGEGVSRGRPGGGTSLSKYLNVRYLAPTPANDIMVPPFFHGIDVLATPI